MARPQKLAGQGLQMVDPGKFPQVRQYVEDPVITHGTLIMSG